MSHQTNKEQQITIPLNDLIFCILGDDNQGLDRAEVTPTVALVLDNFLKDSLRWKIQWNSFTTDDPLEYPLLWRFRDWKENSDRVQRQRVYSEKMRVNSAIEQENLRRIKSVLMTKQKLDSTYAEIMAYKLLRGKNDAVLEFFGVGDLAQSEEDIPDSKPSKFWKGYLK